jgi:long-subunit fatty acid transport protein
MKRLCAAVISFIMVLSFPVLIFGDDSHYTNIMVGDRAGALAGAYTALSDDPSGMYYNPAGITYASGSNLSLSVNGYTSTLKEYKEAIGGRNWSRKSSGIVPNFFGMLYSWGKINMGFSYAVPDQITENQYDTFFDLPSGIPDLSVNKFMVNHKTEDKTYHFGPSFAVEVAPHLSIGVTLYVHYRYADYISNQMTWLSNGQSNWFNHYMNSEEWGVRPILGLMWRQPSKFSLGLAVSRVFPFRSESRLQMTQKDVNDNMTILDPPNSGDMRNYPYRISFGAAFFPFPSLLITADITYYTPTDYTILGTKRNFDAVINGALGSEYRFSKDLALRAGVYTNRSSTPEIKGIEGENGEKVDVYGGSLALCLFTGKTSISVGGSYSSGEGKANITADPAIIDMSYRNWTLFISSTYFF